MKTGDGLRSASFLLPPTLSKERSPCSYALVCCCASAESPPRPSPTMGSLLPLKAMGSLLPLKVISSRLWKETCGRGPRSTVPSLVPS